MNTSRESFRVSTEPGQSQSSPIPSVEALGRSQGGFSTKLHLRAEGHGKPITAVLTGGERHEQTALEALLDRGAIRRPGGAALVCGRADWPATRATAARPPATVCAGGTSGQ